MNLSPSSAGVYYIALCSVALMPAFHFRLIFRCMPKYFASADYEMSRWNSFVLFLDTCLISGNTTALFFSLLIFICHGNGLQIYVHLQVVGHLIDVVIWYECCRVVYELCYLYFRASRMRGSNWLAEGKWKSKPQFPLARRGIEWHRWTLTRLPIESIGDRFAGLRNRQGAMC
jgi:hypothetical protein